MINGLRNTAGFIVACLIISTVRELLAFGTVAGFKVLGFSILPMAQYSFGGFLIIALISGIWAQVVKNYKYKVEVEAQHDERIAGDA